ncbi:Splicing factor ESS-2 [Caenorhabditis elegans]|uniref:Isoform a of Splicing factor ESS-2 n=1 Tax=Caenorhabditis elegans TaxID=6239 RepID=P34420-2|nr:Splicing factor ESS-2 [Caenorhabditis elegans]CCD62885.1 Splicing factor ESS-2 [Caenorhabditis elegans]|eukprot:NP_001022580.1 Splicing factor ESS-2 [Caenorhabditis elegans]
MSSFDKNDERAQLMVPKSINEGKVVKLSQKTLVTKKIERQVVPEEKYIAGLDKIIEKDYFPHLKKMQAQKEYLEAVANKDINKIKELQMKFCSTGSVRTDRSFRTPITTRSTTEAPDVSSFDADTPGPSSASTSSAHDWMQSPMPFANEEGDNEALNRKRKKKKEETLTSYLNKYTSEDNASFEELAKVMREREDARRPWVYKAEEEHNKNLVTRQAIAAEADVQLALKHAVDADDNRPLNVDNWAYKAWNTVLFNPDGAALTPAEIADAARKQQTEINKRGTRFPDSGKLKPSDEAMTRAAVSHALANAGKVDFLGNEVTPANSFKLLETPNPNPDDMDSPLMTWGEIDGTPFRLDAPDVTEHSLPGAAPVFKIPEVPYREKIAQSMNDSIAAKYRDKRKVAMRAAEGAHRTPGFGSKRVSDKLAQLSPAAQKLATKKLGLKMLPAHKSPFASPKIMSNWSRPSSSKRSTTPGSAWSRGSTTPGSSWSQGAQTPGTPGIESMIRRKGDNVGPSTSAGAADRANAGDFF